MILKYKRTWRIANALRVALALVPLFFAVHSWALDPAKSLFQFNCRNWARQDGLPTDKINSITQTKDGYLWLGTQNGLVRFDGRQFTQVPVDLAAALGQDVRKLLTFSDGNLRFVINNGGFGGYDGQHFSTVGDERWWQPGVDGNTIMEARDGTVWLGSDSGLGRWSPRNPADNLFIDATNTGSILSFCESEPGHMWIGTSDHGLYSWTGGKLTHYSDAWLDKHIISAMASTSNEIWLGTDYGLRHWANGTVTEIPGIGAEVKALLLDRHGVLWAGTSGMGLARYENGKIDNLTRADGLGSDFITSLFEDAEGSIWVGTREGVTQISDLKIPLYSRKEGIVDGSTHAVAASQKGGLWIAGDNGLSYFDGTNAANYDTLTMVSSRFIKMCFESRNGEVYAEDADRILDVFSGGNVVARLTNSEWVSAFAEDAQGVVVAAGTGDSIYRVQDGKFVHYHYNDSPAPNYYWVNRMCVAKDGALWVASKNGLFRLEAGNLKHWSTANGLSGDIAAWVCQDDDESIWAGLATGIVRIKDGTVKTINPGDGLADNCVYAIVPDDHGNFWFSSSRGIFRATRKNLNEFADGKATHVECELFNGLEAVKSIGRTDQEYSGCKTIDGRIWFPCPWGVLMVDPAHLPRNAVPPPVHIDHVIVNGKSFPSDKPIIVPPGQTQLEFQMTGLSFLAPEKIKFRYQLDGFDNDWITAQGRNEALYNGLPPGRYAFHVTAANADGVWNPTGESVAVELRPYFRQTAAFYFLCGAAGVVFLAVIYGWRVRHLKARQHALLLASERLEAEVKNRTTELATANDSLRSTSLQLKKRTELLESEIAERERMQKQLLEFSRQAGMAEVATNVLHNVGNVLNSVNVSAQLVADNFRNSKLVSLRKVAAMFKEHAGDLSSFLSADPKGRQLPTYLTDLAEHLTAEQQNAVDEMELLRKNIEHIKDVVAMQQSYAKTAGITEIVKVSDLVEDALRMAFGALEKAGFEIARDFAELPPVVLDKHKVLQILVNLIRNAKHACDDSSKPDKQLKLKTCSIEGFVEVSVTDNGVGIRPENITRIFSHGFTTRKGGHGFGLHSGALAAKELGGSLTVHSDGEGKGATFIVRLPLEPPEVSGHNHPKGTSHTRRMDTRRTVAK
jgi:ligand-binding sensor domain-containing protein/signal transduction histidine kinase